MPLPGYRVSVGPCWTSTSFASSLSSLGDSERGAGLASSSLMSADRIEGGMESGVDTEAYTDRSRVPASPSLYGGVRHWARQEEREESGRETAHPAGCWWDASMEMIHSTASHK